MEKGDRGVMSVIEACLAFAVLINFILVHWLWRSQLDDSSHFNWCIRKTNQNIKEILTMISKR